MTIALCCEFAGKYLSETDVRLRWLHALKPRYHDRMIVNVLATNPARGFSIARNFAFDREQLANGGHNHYNRRVE